MARQHNIMALDPADAALTWFLRHGHRQPRRSALAGCIQALMTQERLSHDAAERHAIQAYAELAERHTREFIDVDETTARVVILRDGDGRRLMLTGSQLADFVAHERTAGRAHRVTPPPRPDGDRP